MVKSKYSCENWRVIVNESGSIYIDRIYKKEFVGIFPKSCFYDRDFLILVLCEKLIQLKKKTKEGFGDGLVE